MPELPERFGKAEIEISVFRQPSPTTSGCALALGRFAFSPTEDKGEELFPGRGLQFLVELFAKLMNHRCLNQAWRMRFHVLGHACTVELEPCFECDRTAPPPSQ